MSDLRKKQLKSVGAVAIGTIAIGIIVALVGGILTFYQNEISSLQANEEITVGQLANISANTTNILAYLCSQQKNPHCSLPQTSSVNLAK